MDSNSKTHHLSGLSENWSKIPLHKKSAVWAEINANALLDNAKQVRAIVGNKVNIMAIVKSDAYGHGAANVSRISDSCIDYLGVSRLSEAVDLRLNSITKPVLLFGYTPPELIDVVISSNVTHTVHSYEMAKDYSDKALKAGKKLKIHVKLDTGMGRLGMFLHKTSELEIFNQNLSTALKDTEKIAALPGLELEGVFTHLSTVDIKDADYAYRQLEAFNDFLNGFKKRGIEFKYCHAAGTFAILHLKNSFFDMVRIGKSLYGILPETNEYKFTQALTVKSVVSFIKTAPHDIRVSYAGAGTAVKSSRIATVPFGFADGYVWQNNSSSYVLIRGRKAPIVGRICMDFMMVDVSKIENVNIGDEVLITGNQGSEKILLSDLAVRLSTTPSSLAVSMTARTPKIITY